MVITIVSVITNDVSGLGLGNYAEWSCYPGPGSELRLNKHHLCHPAIYVTVYSFPKLVS